MKQKVHHSPTHPGFQKLQKTIMHTEHVSAKGAGAILAKTGQSASKSAVKNNPRLKRISGY